jgi:membrane protein DedA with SNARE-associated domain
MLWRFFTDKGGGLIAWAIILLILGMGCFTITNLAPPTDDIKILGPIFGIAILIVVPVLMVWGIILKKAGNKKHH